MEILVVPDSPSFSVDAPPGQKFVCASHCDSRVSWLFRSAGWSPGLGEFLGLGGACIAGTGLRCGGSRGSPTPAGCGRGLACP